MQIYSYNFLHSHVLFTDHSGNMVYFYDHKTMHVVFARHNYSIYNSKFGIS